ncbi:mRNA decay activator protein ZFP36L1-like isoform X2 [Scleropages formosus]|uniref:mRNA decay activator protein ZFP36 n=1 Tax=Scleropages formosus TaxID=113540 RepID=A0A8C9TAJ4_SCLFO|nr:mRNA decay activator protein ZFP36L1-like isoform X2 [Scleropages formosus]
MTTVVASTFFDFGEMMTKNNKTNYNNNILTGSHQIPASCTGSTPTMVSPTGALLDRKAVGTPSTSGMYQRRHSASLPSSKFNQNQFINGLKVDPLPTLGSGSSNKENRFRDRSFSEGGERLLQKSLSMTGSGNSQVNSSRYKTELCRPFEENGACKYGDKCQFAHGVRELRSLSRHPKYKTELCRTFHTIGFCPYGPRCHFVHNAEERRGPPPLSTSNKLERPRLQHSYSFAGFSSTGSLQDSPTSVTPPPIFSTEDLSGWPSNPFTYSSQELGNLFGPSLGGAFSSDLSTQAPPSPTAAYFRPMSESPSSPPESLSDQEGYQSSSGSLSGSESPVLDATRRLPIFSRLSISDE